MNRPILPVFNEYSFSFESDTPEHIEDYPGVPNYVGMYAVFGVVDGVRSYPLAVDVPSEQLAEALAKARAARQESDIELYGYSDDVYIYFPDGSNRRVYYGRKA